MSTATGYGSATHDVPRVIETQVMYSYVLSSADLDVTGVARKFREGGHEELRRVRSRGARTFHVHFAYAELCVFPMRLFGITGAAFDGNG